MTAVKTKNLLRTLRPLPPTPLTFSEAQKILKLNARGALPFETRCVECGISTTHVLPCRIECEQPIVKGRGKTFLHILFGGLLMALHHLPHGIMHILKHVEKEPEVEGDEVVVPAPLRLCPECAHLLQQHPQQVRRMLMAMPVYERLFQQYPAATINIPKP